MTTPQRRRILVLGLEPGAVRDRTAAYNELYQGDHPYTFTISESVGGWVQVEVPVDLSVAHFHNLAKWFEGDSEDAPAEDVLTLSHGDPPWAYWLVPCKHESADWFLTGADAEGRTFQWDCISMRAVDDPHLQRAPMGQRLALMTRKVHASLHKPDATARPFAQVVLHLEPPEPQAFEMPEPGSLADSFERTPDPNADKGGFEQVLEWIGSLLSPGKKD